MSIWMYLALWVWMLFGMVGWHFSMDAARLLKVAMARVRRVHPRDVEPIRINLQAYYLSRIAWPVTLPILGAWAAFRAPTKEARRRLLVVTASAALTMLHRNDIESVLSIRMCQQTLDVLCRWESVCRLNEKIKRGESF